MLLGGGWFNQIRFSVPTSIANSHQQAKIMVSIIIYFLAKDILKSSYETQYLCFAINKVEFTTIIDRDRETKEIYVTVYRNSPLYH